MIEGLPERLRLCRKEYSLTQKEVAERTGISAGTLADYESGHRTPSLGRIMRLADIYNSSIDYLVGRERNNTQDIFDAFHLSSKEKEALLYLVNTFTNERVSAEDNL